MDEIDWVEAAGNYVRLHVGDAEHLHRSSLPDLRPSSGGDATLVLRDGTELELSRIWREAFEVRMTGETSERLP